ncbi:hypothetical protein NIES593_21520 [Hydrococcus rivularis NIES-593]|uniref:Protein kinase domain-containing protein n=1 Tax=Hydrococcus rivularis NIES-593 TaxID=1921803 RepID=A0A1U7H816_9CYAN|nr:serine/threonine-protein kinase [Hydrococcus rivularis]OKH18986.1 hypothetical protein NIES593_21520 [Hydrococcus rivularis NIES-593]
MFETRQILQERYEIYQQLGKKAGRRTLLAWDRQRLEFVVIKLLTFSNDFEWDDLKLFEREAETLKALDHPAIPRYLDFFDLNEPNLKGFALVQTYIAAKSLEQHLKAGRTFSEREVKELAKSLLEILNDLHGRQPPVIHRDIKPSNILLGDRSGNSVGRVYLVDFGSVQTLAAREGGTITVVGTYGYMPPEQFSGRAVPASDLYALGTTLIHLVTGISSAELPQRDLRIHFSDRVNLNPSFRSWLETSIEPALKKRFTTAREATRALERGSRVNTLCSLAGKGIRPLASRVAVVKKSQEVLEIHRYKWNTEGHSCLVVLILYAIAVVFLVSGGFLYAFLILLILMSPMHRTTSKKKSTEVLSFDAQSDRFELWMQPSGFPSRTMDKISNIRFISIIGHSSDRAKIASTWAIVIRTKRSYQLNWDLTEQECIWLVREIQGWIDNFITNQ